MVLIFFLFARMSCSKDALEKTVIFKNNSGKWVYTYHKTGYPDTLLSDYERKRIQDKTTGAFVYAVNSIPPGTWKEMEDSYRLTRQETWETMPSKDTLMVYVFDTATLTTTQDVAASKLRILYITYAQLKRNNDTIIFDE